MKNKTASKNKAKSAAQKVAAKKPALKPVKKSAPKKAVAAKKTAKPAPAKSAAKKQPAKKVAVKAQPKAAAKKAVLAPKQLAKKVAGKKPALMPVKKAAKNPAETKQPKSAAKVPAKAAAQAKAKPQTKSQFGAAKAVPSKKAVKKQPEPEKTPNILELIDKDAILKDAMAEKVPLRDTKKKKGKQRVRAAASIYSSYDEIIALMNENKGKKDALSSTISGKIDSKKGRANSSADTIKKKMAAAPKQTFEVASIADILGFDPREQRIGIIAEKDVPQKWKKYYNLLVDLLEKYKRGVSERSSEILKKSVREESGDLSAYGQHQADVGTESFERDMAFSMISNDKVIVGEIEAAIERIKNGTYGICEYTGKPIPESRLLSIPYTRYTIEGQRHKEDEIRKQKLGARQEMMGEIPSDSISGGDDGE